MKYFLILLVLLGLSGCVTDSAYNVSKVVYIGGKAVVIANADLLPQDTLDKLEKVDELATRYDETRTVIKKAIEKEDNSAKHEVQ
jgi:hypothetical protein